MRVWIVNPYGSLPGEGWREFRATLTARMLVQAGHDVTWWVSNFEHRTKRFRNVEATRQVVVPGFQIRLVSSTPYQRHMSIARIRYEQRFARGFRDAALLEPAGPDVLILGEPALFTSRWVLDYLRRRPARLLVDIGDLWPELFVLALPRLLRRLGPTLFAPLFRRRARLFRAADGLVAVARDYLDLARRFNPTVPHAVVYWGVDITALEQELSAAGPADELLPPVPPTTKTAIYAGTLGENYDIPSILEAAQMLAEDGTAVRIVIAGDGPLAPMVAAASARLPNLIFVGPLAPATLTRIYHGCDLALCTYVRESTVSMPIKAYDYLAAGLPMVNSLGRDLGRIVTEERVGLQYEAGSARGLATAIKELAENDDMREAMSDRAHRLAPRFDWREQYASYVDVVEKLGDTR